MKTQATYAYSQLVQANASRVATGMFNLLDRLQLITTPGEQVAAAALLNVLVADRFGICPHEATKVARTILSKDASYEKGQQFAAARDYLTNEVKG